MLQNIGICIWACRHCLRVTCSVAKHDVMVQSAFKRAPSSRNPTTSSGFPQSQVENWDDVKAEDKTLVHQVTTCITCMPTVVCLKCCETEPLPVTSSALCYISSVALMDNDTSAKVDLIRVQYILCKDLVTMSYLSRKSLWFHVMRLIISAPEPASHASAYPVSTATTLSCQQTSAN